MKKLYIGNYYDGEDENYLVFIGDSTGNRENMLQQAHKAEYGETLAKADIRGVYSLYEAHDYKTSKRYRVHVRSL